MDLVRRLLCWLHNDEGRNRHWTKRNGSVWCYRTGGFIKPAEPEMPAELRPDPYLLAILEEVQRERPL